MQRVEARATEHTSCTVDSEPMEGAVMHEHEPVEIRSSYEGEWTPGFRCG